MKNQDAVSILQYINGFRPDGALIDRFKAAVNELVGDETDIHLNWMCRRFPIFIAVYDTGQGHKSCEKLHSIIRIAAFVSETNVDTVGGFCNLSESRVKLILKLICRLTIETLIFPLRKFRLLKAR